MVPCGHFPHGTGLKDRGKYSSQPPLELLFESFGETLYISPSPLEIGSELLERFINTLRNQVWVSILCLNKQTKINSTQHPNQESFKWLCILWQTVCMTLNTYASGPRCLLFEDIINNCKPPLSIFSTSHLLFQGILLKFAKWTLGPMKVNWVEVCMVFFIKWETCNFANICGFPTNLKSCRS